MSAKRLSLSSKPLIAVVAVALVAVGVVNFRTFSDAGGHGERAAVRMQAAPPFPDDLADVVRLTGEAVALTPPGRGALPALERDPFVGARPSLEATAVRAKAAPAKKKRAPKSGLYCDAVFPGGRHPAAMIKGKPYGVGDKVGAYRVAWIRATGVGLIGADGRERRLAVGTQEDDKGASRVISSLPETNQGGNTRLVEYQNVERKLP